MIKLTELGLRDSWFDCWTYVSSDLRLLLPNHLWVVLNIRVFLWSEECFKYLNIVNESNHTNKNSNRSWKKILLVWIPIIKVLLNWITDWQIGTIVKHKRKYCNDEWSEIRSCVWTVSSGIRIYDGRKPEVGARPSHTKTRYHRLTLQMAK